MDISVSCSGTCTPWATSTDVCSPCDDYSFDAVLLDNCLQSASDILFELSGRQFAGFCQDTVRPCSRPSLTASDYPRDGGFDASFAYGYGNYFVQTGFCGCNEGDRTGCTLVPEITLGAYPIDEIVSVKVDGVTLDASEYRIDDNRYLVRLSNSSGQNVGWPCCQDMTKASTEQGTFEVTVVYGSMPPAAGVRAAAELGCQLALACQPETVTGCRLPQRVTQITRQGVTAVMLDPYDFLAQGKTGLYMCDLFLTTYNPKGLRQRSQVINPEGRRRVRRITS